MAFAALAAIFNIFTLFELWRFIAVNDVARFTGRALSPVSTATDLSGTFSRDDVDLRSRHLCLAGETHMKQLRGGQPDRVFIA